MPSPVRKWTAFEPRSSSARVGWGLDDGAAVADDVEVGMLVGTSFDDFPGGPPPLPPHAPRVTSARSVEIAARRTTTSPIRGPRQRGLAAPGPGGSYRWKTARPP